MAFQGGIPGLGLLSSAPQQPAPPAAHEAANPPPQAAQEHEKTEPVAQAAGHTSNVHQLGQKLEESSLQAAETVKLEPDARNDLPHVEASAALPVNEAQDPAHVKRDDQDGDTAMAENTVPAADKTNEEDASMANGTEDMLERKPKLDPEFLEAAAANKANPSAEWQFDPSDAESLSDSDTSSDDSSSEEDSDEDEYPLLDPAEQARILMQEEYGDDEGGKSTAGQLRTANEVVEEKIEKPDVIVTPGMKITELGDVENIVDNMILIRANTSGEYQVLESGSVLCLENRTVIGAVADTLGRVQEPLYTVAFNTPEEVAGAGLSKGCTVYYVNDHSTYVFTQPLRNLKGTDASNQFDEEVGENEIEFSDDEAEAEYKRQIKQKKRAAQEEKNGPRGGAKAGQQQQAYTGALSYDDDGTDMYTPLARPDNLHQMMPPAGAPVEEQPGSYRPHRVRGKRGGRGGGGGRGGAVPQHSAGYQNQQSRAPQAQHQQSFSAFQPPQQQANQSSQPFQFNSPQAYAWPQNTSTPFNFGANQAGASGASNFPAGSFVNPAFFQSQQQQPQQQQQPYGMQAPYQAPQQPSAPQWNNQQAADAWRMIQAMAAAQQANTNNGQSQQQQQQNYSQQASANSAATVQEILRNLSSQNNNGAGQ